VVLVVLAAAGLLGFYAVTHLGVDTSTAGLVRHSESYRLHRDRYKEAFPDAGKELLVVVEASTPEGARLAAERLVAHLRAETGLFSEVEWAGGGPFFDRHQLLYLDLADLEELVNELAEAQPLMARLSGEPTLPKLFETLALAAGPDAEEVPLELDAVFARLARAIQASRENRSVPVSWTELMSGRDFDEDERRQFIVTYPDLDNGRWLMGDAAIEAVRVAAAELRLAENHGARVRLTGEVAFAHDERRSLQRDGILIAVLSLVLVAVVLWLGLRSVRLIGVSLITLLAGLAMTTAFAAAVVGDLNMISVAFAALYIGIGIDYAIHLGLRVREAQRAGGPPEEAIREVPAALAPTLLTCTVSTGIGFFAFIPTAYRGIAQLGLIAGTGIVITFALSVTFFPALLRLMRYRARPPRPIAEHPVLRRLAGVPQRHGVLIRMVTGVVAVVALLALPWVRFDFNPLNLRDPASESIQTLVAVQSDPRVSYRAVNVLVDSADAEEALVRRFEDDPEIGRVRSFDSLLPENQEQKLALLDELALILGPGTLAVETATAPPTVEERRRALAEFAAVLRGQPLSPAGEQLAGEAEAFLAVAAGAPPALRRERWDHLQAMLLGTLPEALRQLSSSLEADRIAPESLPGWLRDKWLGKGGERRVEIRPEESFLSGRTLERFVDGVQEAAPNAVGPPVAERSIGRAITKSFAQAVIIAVLLIAVLLLVVFRNAGDTLRVLATLGLTGLLTAAATVPLGIAFNFANVIAIPLLLGLGVDATIHLVRRWRKGALSVPDLLRTATARAVVISALTTMCSFSSLAFAGHRGMASMGHLLFAGTLLMLWVNLQLLPAFLGRRRDKADVR